MAGARAAELFRNRDAEETHLGEAFPQLLVIGRLAVKHSAHRLRRALLAEEFTRGIAHLLLVVGEIEVHGGLLVLLCRMGGAKRYPSRWLLLMGFAALNPSYGQFKMMTSWSGRSAYSRSTRSARRS